MKNLVFALLPALGLTGCFSPHAAAPDAVLDQQGQYLPIGARANIAGETIQLELARTSQEKQVGFMWRSQPFDKDRGMLFDYPGQPMPQWFHMKNVKFPLDIVFLRDGVVQAIASNAQPCTADPCMHYDPKVPIDRVVELRAGRAKELKLKAGDFVDIQVTKP